MTEVIDVTNANEALRNSDEKLIALDAEIQLTETEQGAYEQLATDVAVQDALVEYAAEPTQNTWQAFAELFQQKTEHLALSTYARVAILFMLLTVCMLIVTERDDAGEAHTLMESWKAGLMAGEEIDLPPAVETGLMTESLSEDVAQLLMNELGEIDQFMNQPVNGSLLPLHFRQIFPLYGDVQRNLGFGNEPLMTDWELAVTVVKVPITAGEEQLYAVSLGTAGTDGTGMSWGVQVDASEERYTAAELEAGIQAQLATYFVGVAEDHLITADGSFQLGEPSAREVTYQFIDEAVVQRVQQELWPTFSGATDYFAGEPKITVHTGLNGKIDHIDITTSAPLERPGVIGYFWDDSLMEWRTSYGAGLWQANQSTLPESFFTTGVSIFEAILASQGQ